MKNGNLDKNLEALKKWSGAGAPLFDISKMGKGFTLEHRYVLAIEKLDSRYFTYSLARMVDGNLDFILQKTLHNEVEFDREVSNLSRYFAAEINDYSRIGKPRYIIPTMIRQRYTAIIEEIFHTIYFIALEEKSLPAAKQKYQDKISKWNDDLAGWSSSGVCFKEFSYCMDTIDKIESFPTYHDHMNYMKQVLIRAFENGELTFQV